MTTSQSLDLSLREDDVLSDDRVVLLIQESAHGGTQSKFGIEHTLCKAAKRRLHLPYFHVDMCPVNG